MADKRRPRLRDEVSASLEGLDDLAAGLEAEPAAGDAVAPVAETEPALEDLDPDMEASLAEVRELADELAAPDTETESGTGTLPPPPAGPLPAAPAAAEAFVPPPPPPPPAPDLVFEAVPSDTEEHAGETGAGHDETAYEFETEDEGEAEAGSEAETATEDESDEAETETEDEGEDVEDDVDDSVDELSGADASPAEATPAEELRPVTEAVMPAAPPAAAVAAAPSAGDGAQATVPVLRAWSPAAAMEPVPPLAPPPARPLTTPAEAPVAKLPADGGKRMNILPVVMIALFVLVVVALVLIAIRQT